MWDGPLELGNSTSNAKGASTLPVLKAESPHSVHSLATAEGDP
jgi:hypothetical protein